MSKSVERICPACKIIKEFRIDQKTCGCAGSQPFVGKGPKKLSEVASARIERNQKAENTLEEAKSFLLGKKRNLVDLADRLSVPPREARKIIDQLKEKGHNVSVDSETVVVETSVPPGGKLVVNSADFFDGRWFKFGAVGDTHLYSKYARMDVLNCLYDIFAQEKIKTVFHTGNAIDGEARFNKFDLIGPSGIGNQVEYFALNYPARRGIVTRFVTGDDHEGWYINREGVNIGQLMEDAARSHGRKDLQWLGHVEADVHFKAPRGEAWMRVMHPGGGSAYAISYTEQKIIESFQGGEKPHILLLGHYHKFNQGYPREVHTVQTGTTQDQTPFLRKLKIQAHVGGCIVRFHQADTGEINRFHVEWIPFYDKGFYEKNDKYRRW
jgi:hypothetical protein